MSPDHDSETSRWIAGVLAEYEQRLARYAAGITGDADAARDVVQDVFLQLCRAKRGAVEGHLAAWLFKVCRHRALDVRRKERRMTLTMNGRLDRIAPPADSAPHRLAEAPADETIAGGMLTALATLPERQQELLRLKFQAGLSYAEIARCMDLTTTNVGFLIHTALKKLREHCRVASTEF